MPEGSLAPDANPPSRPRATQHVDARPPPAPSSPLGKAPSPADAQFIASVEDMMERLVRSHSTGRLREAALAHVQIPGRRVRVRLAASAADALGLTRDKIIPWAAAIELLHNATLVHDDLQDRDEVRRGAPTTWKQYGDNEAINVGDLLLMLPTLALEDERLSDTESVRLTRALHRRACGCVDGQSTEQSLLSTEALSFAEWERCARGKTGHLFALPIEGAAILAGESVAMAQSMGDAFADAGIVFQMVDDVLDLFGAHNGKGRGHGRRGSDVYEGRVSSLIAEYIAFAPGARETVLALLRTPADKTDAADVRALALRIRESGALDAVLARMHQVCADVLQHPAFSAATTLLPLCEQWLKMLTAALADVDTELVPEAVPSPADTSAERAPHAPSPSGHASPASRSTAAPAPVQ